MSPHVLVVEDETPLRRIVVRNLEARGYRVTGVGTANDAMGAIEAGDIDIMLLDINLPDLTGWELLRRLTPELRQRVPTIVLSASPLAPGRVEEFQPAGVLLKPFPMDALLRLVAEASEGVTKEVGRA